MMTFLFLTFLIACLLAFSSVHFYRQYGDILHPSLVLNSLFFFLYAAMPAYLVYENAAMLFSYLPLNRLNYVQTINLTGISFLVAGLYFGSRGKKARRGHRKATAYSRERAYMAAQVIGLMGLMAFLIGLANVGGFTQAYDQAYGGGGHTSGYMREAYMLGVPAMILMIYSRAGRKLRSADAVWILVFMSPLLIHGILGARRGPLFMVLIGFAFAYYMSRGKRPSISRMAVLLFSTGMLLLFLVANRANIYLGTEDSLAESPTELILTLEHNEFTYGAGTILMADRTGDYHWGGRYLAVVLVRPIPRQLFPTKWEFAAEWLGIPNLEEGNMGTDIMMMQRALGWRGAYGAAPGIIADLWVEFWAFMTIAMFLIGFGFSRIWRNATRYRDTSMFHYPLLISLSAYLIMQTFEAFIFRTILYGTFLFIAVKFVERPRRSAAAGNLPTALKPG